jgi:hydroxyacylglutathione hydrolase
MYYNSPISINQIINPDFCSNTYVIHDSHSNSVIIIDPGEKDSKSLIDLLSKKRINNYFVILTHEHYDHISGLKSLCPLFEIDLILSSSCFNNLNNPKKNLSDYLDVEVIDTLSPNKFYIVQDNESMSIDKHNFKFYYTPGHSEGSMCVGLDNMMFTGDTLMKNYKTVTNLPGGSKSIYEKTKNKLKDILISYEIVYPGHGSVYKI